MEKLNKLADKLSKMSTKDQADYYRSLTEPKRQKDTYSNFDVDIYPSDILNPEDQYIASEKDEVERLLETYSKICPKLTKLDVEVLTNLKSITEASIELGVSYDAYRKRLYRKRQLIKKALLK